MNREYSFFSTVQADKKPLYPKDMNSKEQDYYIKMILDKLKYHKKSNK